MRKFIICVATMVATFATPAIPGEILDHPPLPIAGIGAISCETFADMTALEQTKNVTEAAVFDWAQGWMTGANYALRIAAQVGSTWSPEKNLYAWSKEQQMNSIRSYCHTHRVKYVFVDDAVSALFLQLPETPKKARE
jgi:hypothetical protein